MKSEISGVACRKLSILYIGRGIILTWRLMQIRYCNDGDLLYARRAAIVGTLRIWEGGKVIYQYRIWKTVVKRIKASPRVSVSTGFTGKTDDMMASNRQGAGTTMFHVTKGSMEHGSFPLPPLPEQKRIVAILDEAFHGYLPGGRQCREEPRQRP